ncbi:C40 family peptidase [Ramlibacter sp. AN1015]|uniref:C40 family peptidase n=1 Tax=Ramlibacter sp. AN1015 TaxID=3133428 RepID=UPI0030C1621E
MLARLRLRPLLLASTLVLALPSQAARTTSAEEDVGRFMEDKGLFTRVEQVGNSVMDRAGTMMDRAGTVRDRASELVVNAMGFLGVPYRRGGSSADTGFDCSGFVRAIYEQSVGLVLPRRANEQAAATQVIDKQDLEPGDLVFFNTMRRAFSHVGIYVGDGKFIHSPRAGAQVRVENMGGSYWSKRFDGARRVAIAGEAQN